MFNPFMTVGHCARYALRQAFRSGDVAHVVATGNETMPLMVIDEHNLFELAEQLSPADVMFTADPFADVQAG